jgi:hypothetical protein
MELTAVNAKWATRTHKSITLRDDGELFHRFEYLRVAREIAWSRKGPPLIA